MTDDPASENPPDWWPYAAEFPRWHAWRGVDQLYHARLADTDAAVRGEDPDDLRNEIIRKLAHLGEVHDHPR
jgi:hypothetical protein